MGAVPGGGFLSTAAREGDDRTPRWFDVEPFRSAGRRMVIRQVDGPTLVLGSTQSPAIVDVAMARRDGVTVVNRRSGGGAVLVGPGAQVWIDLWLPRGDPLWTDDPRRTAVNAGEWWADGLGAPSFEAAVHRGGPMAAPGSDLICFAGVGPGEVLAAGRKVVGLAQWRCREGALVHGCAYLRWDPVPLLRLLTMDDGSRRRLASELAEAAAGLDDLGVPGRLEDRLAATLPGAGWEVLTG